MFHISRCNSVTAVVSFIVITKSIIFPFFEVISKCQNHSNYSYQSNRTMMNNLLHVIVLVNKDLYNYLYLRGRENPRVHSHVLSLSIILLVVTKLFNNNDCWNITETQMETKSRVSCFEIIMPLKSTIVLYVEQEVAK